MHCKPGSKLMTQTDCVYLFSLGSDCDLSTRDASFAYAMSKMTVIAENEDMKQYEYIHFVEFLEMIGRSAEIKFRDSE